MFLTSESTQRHPSISSCAQQKGASPALRQSFLVGIILIKHSFALSVHTAVEGCSHPYSSPYSSSTKSSINLSVIQLAKAWMDAFLKLSLRCKALSVSQVDRNLWSEIILILTIKQTGQKRFFSWIVERGSLENINTQSEWKTKFFQWNTARKMLNLIHMQHK